MPYLVGCIAAFSWFTLCVTLFYAAVCQAHDQPIVWNIVSIVLIIVVVLDSSILTTIRSKYKLVELEQAVQPIKKDKEGDDDD